jgi:predicted Zn-dependent protease
MDNFEDKMDDYIQNKMNDLDRKVFEKELAEDPDKKERFEQHKEVIQIIEIASLKEQLDRLEHKVDQEKKSSSQKKSKVINLFPRAQMIGIAASLTILIVAAVWIFYPSQNNSDHFAFRKYYQKDPGLPTTMGVSDQITLDQAMLLYKQNNYQEALQAFETLLNETPNDTVQYYYAMSLMELDQFAEAEKTLRKLELKSSNLQQRRDWYLIMALLQLNREDEAIELVNEIIDQEQHLYKNDAKRLFEEIQ